MALETPVFGCCLSALLWDLSAFSDIHPHFIILLNKCLKTLPQSWDSLAALFHPPRPPVSLLSKS